MAGKTCQPWTIDEYGFHKNCTGKTRNHVYHCEMPKRGARPFCVYNFYGRERVKTVAKKYFSHAISRKDFRALAEAWIKSQKS